MRSGIHLLVAVSVGAAVFLRGLATPTSGVERHLLHIDSTKQGIVRFRLTIADAFRSVEPSCECVEIESIRGDLVIGSVDCRGLPPYVTPGVFIYPRAGAPQFVRLTCP